jgi:DNA-binding transcriptional LysR family regulator
MQPRTRIELDDGEALTAVACLGLGIVPLPDSMVRDELAEGRLVELLPRHCPPSLPISAGYPSGRRVPLRVRALPTAIEALGRIPAACRQGASP